jgi:hypothetical protein
VELLLPVPEVPVAPYGVDDEADSESCSDCKNCCRMSLAELVPDELLVLEVAEIEVMMAPKVLKKTPRR